MQHILKLFWIIIFLSGAHLHAQDIVSGGRLKQNQVVYDVFHYNIALDVDIAKKSISGTTVIKIKLKENTPEIAIDLINLYQVKSIWIDKTKVGFTHMKDMIILRDQHLLTPGWHDIKIEYSGIPPVAVRPPWKGGIQWEKDDNNDPWVAFSCQNEGAKILFPCKDHPSDKPDEGAEMKISVPKGLKVAGPGRLIKEETAGNKSVFTWKTS